MIASMFNLDQRLAELRPSEADQCRARQVREAAVRAAAGGGSRDAGPAALAAAGSPSSNRFGNLRSRVTAR